MDVETYALITLGRLLRSRGYRFVAVTPATHCRVLERSATIGTLESIFGWNRPFDRAEVDDNIVELLEDAESLEVESGRCRSSIRFATIGELLFVHSSFPTAEEDAVFFGPDTYRFVRLLRESIADTAASESMRLIDVGSGSGAGGIFAAHLLGKGAELLLADINRKALTFSAVNAILNDLPLAKPIFSDVLAGIEGEADIIIANPPYLVDDDRRLYRHGGGELGISLALRIAEEGLPRLRPGGQLILYTGTPILNGADPLIESLQPSLQLYASHFVYEEIDPDVFGEELDRPAYANADRIAAVGLTAIKRG
jgi:methylase of polypeptide subunit release factors